MNDDPNFNPRKARQARDSAMDAVDRAANEAWKAVAIIAVYQVAIERPFLSTDNVLIRQKELNDNVHTHDLRALGPVMRKAQSNGWIKKSRRLPISCARRSRHAAPITVWESLLNRERKKGLFVGPQRSS